MKKLLATAVLVLGIFAANAQDISLKAGYTLSDVLVSPEPGNIFTSKNTFHFGIVMNNLQLTDRIGIQPELLYSMQGFKVAGIGNVGMHYLAAPILVKLPMNDELSILVGPQVSYLVNARLGLVNDLFSVSYNGLFKSIDVGAVGGLEYKVTDKMAIGGRYTLGLTDVNKDFQITSNRNFSDYFQIRNTNAQFYVTFGFGGGKKND
jgi:Outer membrane protein beta-barrel domain